MAKTPNQKVAISPDECTQLSEDLALSDQTWRYSCVRKIPGGPKLRIIIKRNAYDFQSLAYVEVFSLHELKWNVIVEVPFTKALKVHVVSYVDRESKIDLFREDADMLFDRAMAVLS